MFLPSTDSAEKVALSSTALVNENAKAKFVVGNQETTVRNEKVLNKTNLSSSNFDDLFKKSRFPAKIFERRGREI